MSDPNETNETPPDSGPKADEATDAAIKAAPVAVPKPPRIRLNGVLPGGVDRMCQCGHTLGAHYKADGRCAGYRECKCLEFYPEEF